MKRLFLGIPVPQKIAEGLTAYTSSLTDDTLKFVKPENYHVTVNFFGEQNDTMLPAIKENIQKIVENSEPFELLFNEIAFAPPKGEPSMIWAQYASSDQFTGLVSRVEDALKDVITFADQRNGHEPIPHITLARFKYQTIEQLPQLTLDPIRVETLALFDVTCTDTGHVYKILDTFPLL